MLQEITYTPTTPRYKPQAGGVGRVTRCRDCTIRIFSSPGEAALAGVNFYAHINLNVNGRCPDCAGHRQVDYQVQKEIETMLSSNGSGKFHFDHVEQDVEEPSGGYSKGRSKYSQAAKVVFESAVDKWHRMQVADKKSAVLFKGHCYKVAAGRKNLKITGRIVEEDGVTWLYWMLFRPEKAPNK